MKAPPSSCVPPTDFDIFVRCSEGRCRAWLGRAGDTETALTVIWGNPGESPRQAVDRLLDYVNRSSDIVIYNWEGK